MGKLEVIKRPEGMIEVGTKNLGFFESCLLTHRKHYPDGYKCLLLSDITPAATRAIFNRIWYQRPKALKIGEVVLWVEGPTPHGAITIHELTVEEYEKEFINQKDKDQ